MRLGQDDGDHARNSRCSSANVRSGSERVVRKAHFTMFTDWGVLIQLLCFHYTATAFSKALSVTVI